MSTNLWRLLHNTRRRRRNGSFAFCFTFRSSSISHLLISPSPSSSPSTSSFLVKNELKLGYSFGTDFTKNELKLGYSFRTDSTKNDIKSAYSFGTDSAKNELKSEYSFRTDSAKNELNSFGADSIKNDLKSEYSFGTDSTKYDLRSEYSFGTDLTKNELKLGYGFGTDSTKNELTLGSFGTDFTKNELKLGYSFGTDSTKSDLKSEYSFGTDSAKNELKSEYSFGADSRKNNLKSEYSFGTDSTKYELKSEYSFGTDLTKNELKLGYGFGTDSTKNELKLGYSLETDSTVSQDSTTGSSIGDGFMPANGDEEVSLRFAAQLVKDVEEEVFVSSTLMPRLKDGLLCGKGEVSGSYRLQPRKEGRSIEGLSLFAKREMACLDGRLRAGLSSNSEVNTLADRLQERIAIETCEGATSSSTNGSYGLEDVFQAKMIEEKSQDPLLSTNIDRNSSEDALQEISKPETETLVVGRILKSRETMKKGRSGDAEKYPESRIVSDYPVPLSPRMGEAARCIEFDRAMAAEAAMKAGPAVSGEAILYEDEWMIVVNKPCGFYSEHVMASIPCLLNNSYTYLPPFADPLHGEQTTGAKTELPHLHMANRLDRDTSGVMVITKCKTAAKKLMHIFTARKVKKTYIALCIGIQPTWSTVTIESGHGRSKNGAWRVYAKRDVGRMLPGGSKVKEMITHLSIVKRTPIKCGEEGYVEVREENQRDSFEDQVIIVGEEKDSSLAKRNLCSELFVPDEEDTELPEAEACIRASEVFVKAFPLTGRTHQIRLHCQYLGLSLRGDVKYGGPHAWNGTKNQSHALHAESLSLMHPITFTDLHFVAPLPQWAL
ncbi:hypothetical protein O6H91_07G061400 [Diphasiastrum complanatum]|uniref:Uncharacterized protein n=1 Tax=Diphasiastrum complanatum TaxID=34168 RepID=A0ACC2D5X7_DIPCM|nr:hypothetical protein O6H91_07G061400 [Diphasiastrum complanatum]